MRCSSPLLRPWARMWINHSSLWRMASPKPDLWLPYQSQDIAAARLVPTYTEPKVVTWQRLIAGSWTRDLSIASQRLHYYTTKPHLLQCIGLRLLCFKNHDYYFKRCWSILLNNYLTLFSIQETNCTNILLSPNSFAFFKFSIRIVLYLLISLVSQLGVKCDVMHRIFN